MYQPRRNISYRKVGETVIWVNRVSPSLIEVIVFDGFEQTEQRTDVATLDEALAVVSDAVSRELRRQQGETL
jgi:hypothetical protein